MENKEKFIELYNRLYSENYNELETLRKQDEKPVKKILWIVAIIFICFIIFGILVFVGFANVFSSNGEVGSMIGLRATIIIGGFLLMIMTFVMVNVIFKQAKKTSVVREKGAFFEGENPDDKTYKSIFKEKIIKPIIQLALPESNYFFDEGLTEQEYFRGKWEKYNTYHAEDKVITNKLIMSEVHTENIRRDSEGRTEHITLFHGLAGYIELPKDIGCYIKVINNNVFGKSIDNLQMDMPEFEKVFDVKTDDKIKAMQILTADIMTEFLELIKKNDVKFEFYMDHSIMHIRFHTGELFEPAVFKESLQFEYLEKYFNVISSVKDITEHICNVIMEVEL